ncbi:ABC transporter ATP-binding protein [Lysinibacillus sp. JNUCC-52]|uniref:ABC transporter ATP-binding protein n=1 Tax=Lysinibacillus sp. JNUCC-52 TaxID=2792480 RepID=UPI001934CDE1|nr:ABC transporter ATP-binding protein [Lysinibacillus sp. JNUCC-52]
MSNLLEINNLRKSYGDKVVLDDVSFNVPPGAIVGFIGNNGAGKSTTFKAVLELVHKESGTVKLFGKENLNKEVKLKEKIGVVFDAINLPSNLTIKQLGKAFSKLFSSWNQNEFNRLVDIFALPRNKKVSSFSRGMSMKISIAVALSHNAQLLILDEATGGLDPSSREVVLDELENFAKEADHGIVLSSHIMSDIERIASHLVFISEGKITLNEEKDIVFEKYAFVDLNDSEQLTLINKDIIVARRKHGASFTLLISDKKKLPSGLIARKISMEEISVFLTGSAK